MITSAIQIDDESFWTQEGDCIRRNDVGADMAFMLPETLRLVARKLFAIRKLISGTEEPREYEDVLSLNTCEALTADAGHDLELILDEFERWIKNPDSLRHSLTEATGKQSALGNDAADDAVRENVIAVIAERLRELPSEFGRGLLATLTLYASEHAEAREESDDKKPYRSGIEAVESARKGLESHVIDEDDSEGQTFPITVTAWRYEGAGGDDAGEVIDLIVTPQEFKELRRDIRNVASRYARAYAATIAACGDGDNKNEPDGVPVQPARTANAVNNGMIVAARGGNGNVKRHSNGD